MNNTGKIFDTSTDIYQDQAKILYYYYQDAAKKIVEQEEVIEKEVAELQKYRDDFLKEKKDCWIWFLTIVAFFMYWVKRKKIDKVIAEIDQEIELKKREYVDIFRDYSVSNLGVVYVPVAKQIAYGEKGFMVDLTNKTDLSKVNFQVARQSDLLVESMKKIEKLSSEAPLVESVDNMETIDTNEYSLSIQEVNEGDYMGQLDRSLKTIAFCMNDTEVKEVELPLVVAGSEYINFINEYATDNIGNHPVVDVFGKNKFDDRIEVFQNINEMRKQLSNENEQFEEVLKHLMHSMALSVQTISSIKLASTNKMVDSGNYLLLNLLKAPYNHYSPLLEAEEINRIRNEKFDYSDSVQGYEPFHLKESSKVKFNLITGEWIAEDNSTTQSPFGVHQIYEEILAPMVQNLMMENRLERIKVYSHINDQKLSYLNKWHQDVDAFYRSNHAESADIINDMQQTLSDYIEAFNTLEQLQQTINTMAKSASLDGSKVETKDNSAEVMASFQMQAQEFKDVQEEFNDFMDRLQEDIASKAEKFGHVEFYDASLQDGYSNSVAVATAEVNELDERRQNLAIANPLLAKQATLLPEPKVEDVTYEHMSINLPALAMNSINEINEIKDNVDTGNNSDNTEKDSQQDTQIMDTSDIRETDDGTPDKSNNLKQQISLFLINAIDSINSTYERNSFWEIDISYDVNTKKISMSDETGILLAEMVLDFDFEDADEPTIKRMVKEMLAEEINSFIEMDVFDAFKDTPYKPHFLYLDENDQWDMLNRIEDDNELDDEEI